MTLSKSFAGVLDGVAGGDLIHALTMTFLVWDTLINLDEEIEYIWARPGGWVKWLYLFVRHTPYLIQGSIMALLVRADNTWSEQQCKALIAYQLGINEILTVAVEVILIIRIYAMFNRNRFVIAIVYSLFAAEIAAMCTVLAIALPQVRFTAGCFIKYTTPFFSTYWTISLAFETMLFGLTVFKFFTSMSVSGVSRQSIMFVLMRDGTWAYATLFVVMLLNTLLYELEKNTLDGLFYFWELSVLSSVGSHVLLNLRRHSMQPSGSPFGDSTFGRTTARLEISDLEFEALGHVSTTMSELTTLRSR